jgi:hypothetical protein
MPLYDLLGRALVDEFRGHVVAQIMGRVPLDACPLARPTSASATILDMCSLFRYETIQHAGHAA